MENLNAAQIAAFNRDGYLIIQNFFSREEVDKLYKIASEDDNIDKNSYNMNDKSGKRSRLALWYTPGDDAFGLLSRSARIINPSAQLMDGDSAICHFHSKLMQKEPKVGGAWEWHQDYGYWYRNEFLLPDQLLSVMTAITEANKENGCLQVIRGSHKMGRVEHGFAGDQVGASQRYVELALKTMELVYVELLPGDVLFFHSNLLHRSEANLSESARWSFISCYNRLSNTPYNEPHASSTTPLDIVENLDLLNNEVHGIAGDADFLTKDTDVSLKKTENTL